MDGQKNVILKYDQGLNAQHVKTNERPQNFIKNVEPSQRYNKYPRIQQLMQEKNSWIQQRNHPPVYIKQNLKEFDFSSLGKFDAIYCDPPWEQYEKKAKRLNLFHAKQDYYKSMKFEQLNCLNIEELADSPSFIFLWVGSEHLDDGRQLLKKWGFKRCQDIVWVKTNIKKNKIPLQSDQGILIRVKQHCLVGYKGEAKKASDHKFIHPNIDIDVIVTEEPEIGSLEKPAEVYDIIERFCLGRKKIELFGVENGIRNGWLTIGSQLRQTKFSREQYDSWFNESIPNPQTFLGGRLLGTTPMIENLRPKEDPKVDDEGKKSITSNK